MSNKYDSDVANVYRQLAPDKFSGLNDDEVVGVAAQLDPQFNDRYKTVTGYTQGEGQYNVQHPIETDINSAGNMAQDALKYNPLVLLGKAFDALGRGADSVANAVPGLKDINQDMAVGKKALSMGAAAINSALPNSPLPSGSTLESFLPGSLGEAGSMAAQGAIGPNEIADAIKAGYDFMPSGESILKSRLGRLGGGNVPFDEVAKARGAANREIAAQAQSAEALQAQKEGTLGYYHDIANQDDQAMRNSAIDLNFQKNQTIEQAQAAQADVDSKLDVAKQALKNRDLDASTAVDALNSSLSAIDTVGPRPMSAGMDLKSKLDIAKAADAKKLDFPGRYAEIKELGDQVPDLPAANVAQFAKDNQDHLDSILNTTGDARLRKTLQFFRDMTTETDPSPYGSTVKPVNFNDLLDSQKTVRNAISDLYNVKEDRYDKNAPILMGLNNEIQNALERQSGLNNPDIMKKLSDVNSDYRDYRTKYGDAFKSIRYGSTSPEDILKSTLSKESNIAKVENIVGPEAFQSVRKFRSKEILRDIVGAAQSGKDPESALTRHLTGNNGYVNNSLFSQDEIDHLTGIASDLKNKVEAVSSTGKDVDAAENNLGALQSLRDVDTSTLGAPEKKALGPEKTIEDLIKGEPGQPDKKAISMMNRRETDIGSTDLKRSTDQAMSEKLGALTYRHLPVVVGSTLAASFHNPYILGLSAALDIGPQALAHLYVSDTGGAVRKAIDTAIVSATKTGRFGDIGKLATLTSAHKAFYDKSNENK